MPSPFIIKRALRTLLIFLAGAVVSALVLVSIAANSVRATQQPVVCASKLWRDSGAAGPPAYLKYQVKETWKGGGIAVWTFGAGINEDSQALAELKRAAPVCKFEFLVKAEPPNARVPTSPLP